MNDGRIGRWGRKGIRCMLDFSKRWGPQFLISFAALAAGAAAIPIWLHGGWQYFTAILLGSFSFICLVATIIALYYDIRDARQRDKVEKDKITHQALVEAFKMVNIWGGMSEAEAEQLAEIAATGRTEPYQPVDGLDD